MSGRSIQKPTALTRWQHDVVEKTKIERTETERAMIDAERDEQGAKRGLQTDDSILSMRRKAGQLAAEVHRWQCLASSASCSTLLKKPLASSSNHHSSSAKQHHNKDFVAEIKYCERDVADGPAYFGNDGEEHTSMSENGSLRRHYRQEAITEGARGGETLSTESSLSKPWFCVLVETGMPCGAHGWVADYSIAFLLRSYSGLLNGCL
ncbi:hypothetical protein HJC23_001838 [Cyclotella cryptica]|uniref:Uncharacterized protein n=1 Tax=Cyclotella cryptica TaxID=29204 RepID=A0ABD3PJG1_9STRA